MPVTVCEKMPLSVCTRSPMSVRIPTIHVSPGDARPRPPRPHLPRPAVRAGACPGGLQLWAHGGPRRRGRAAVAEMLSRLLTPADAPGRACRPRATPRRCAPSRALDGHGLPAVSAAVTDRAMSPSSKAVISEWQEHDRWVPGVGEVNLDQSSRAVTRSAGVPRAPLGVAGHQDRRDYRGQREEGPGRQAPDPGGVGRGPRHGERGELAGAATGQRLRCTSPAAGLGALIIATA